MMLQSDDKRRGEKPCIHPHTLNRVLHHISHLILSTTSKILFSSSFANHHLFEYVLQEERRKEASCLTSSQLEICFISLITQSVIHKEHRPFGGREKFYASPQICQRFTSSLLPHSHYKSESFPRCFICLSIQNITLTHAVLQEEKRSLDSSPHVGQECASHFSPHFHEYTTESFPCCPIYIS